MALIFDKQYEQDFNTNAGSNIDYTVEIWRSYDDADPTPPWFGNVKDLTGAGEPITISYGRDYDVYKTIQGAKAELNLKVERDGQYDNFANGLPYEYQLRVRRRITETTFEEIFKGYFSPTESKEIINSYPFEVSYTALDGLGRLQQSTPEHSEDDSQVNAFAAFIVPALAETGLDLPIYVDSGIQRFADSDDALLNATVSNYARYKSLEGTGELFTHKELLDGYLSPYNCKVTQAKGRWNIYNASTLSDTTTWKVFNMQGIALPDVTENLVKTIDGTESANLIPAHSDLQDNLRPGYGSIQCKPKDLVEKQFAANGDFYNNADGWTLSTNTTYDATEQAVSIISNFRVVDGETESTIVNTVGFPVNDSAPVEVKFDWEATKIRDDGVILGYQIYAEFDTMSFQDFLFPTFGETYNNNHTYEGSVNRSTLYWDNANEFWSQKATDGTVIESEATSVDTNITASATAAALSEFSDALNGTMQFNNLRLFVKVFPLQAVNGKTNRNNSTTDVSALVDNISVKNMFDDRILSPTFERVQANYTETHTYEPLFSSSTPSAIYQTLTPRLYKRPGNAVDAVSGLTLEQLGTQQKLNDFRGQDGTVFGSPFKYYEGTLINLDESPLSNINKVKLNWVGVYVELNSGIMNGGTWRLKSNTFDTSFYIPNQALDIAPGNGSITDGVASPGFYRQNVDLIAMPFPGLSSKRTYTLAFNIETVDTTTPTPLTIANGLVPDPPYFTFVGEPGTTRDYLINLEPAIIGDVSYGGVASATAQSPESVDKPRPIYTEVTGPSRAVYKNLIIPITVTIPKESIFEQLYLDGVVTPFTQEGNLAAVSASVTVTNTGNFLKGGNTPVTYDTSGVPLTVKQFTHTISPLPNPLSTPTNPLESDYQLFSGNFDVTEATGSLEYKDPEGGIDSVSVLYTYTVPIGGGSSTSTVTGSATTRGIVGVDLSEIIVDFGPEPAGVTWHEQSNTFTGIPTGTSDGYKITVIPDANQEITGITVDTFPTGVVASGVPYKADENWEIPIQVTYPALVNSGDTVTMGISVDTEDEPYQLNFTSTNLGGEGFTITPGEHQITFHNNDLDTPIAAGDNFVVTVSSNDGMEFTDVDQVIIDIGETQVGLPENLLTRNKQLTNGNIDITIGGDYPKVGGVYNIALLISATAPLDAAALAEQQRISNGFKPTVGYVFQGIDGGATLPFTERWKGSVIYLDAAGNELIQHAGFVDGSVSICAQVVAPVPASGILGSPRLAPDGLGSFSVDTSIQGLCDTNLFGRRGVPYAGDSSRVNGFEFVLGTSAPPTGTSENTITLIPASTS